MAGELFDLAERKRPGAGGPSPLEFLHADCPMLLRLVSDALPTKSVSGPEREDFAKALLEYAIANSNDPKVKSAGDLLGITELDSKAILELYRNYIGSQKPAHFERYGRQTRLIIATRHWGQMSLETVKKREPGWMEVLAKEIPKLLGSQATLEALAKLLGLTGSWRDAAGQVSEDSTALPAATVPPQHRGQPARRRWLFPVAFLAAVVLGAATTVAFNLTRSSSIDSSESLHVNTSWPLARGCDGATAVAMLPGKAEVGSFSASTDPRRDIAASDGGGVWIMGHLYLNLAGADGTPIQIFELKPEINRVQLPSPAWTLGVEGGCGDSYERVFRLDLDKGSIEDIRVQGTKDDASDIPRTESLGPAFTVTDRDPALVRVDAVACKGNYEWKLSIRYYHEGKEGHVLLGPYRSLARAENTTSYTQRQVDGRAHFVKDAPVSGTPQGWPC